MERGDFGHREDGLAGGSGQATAVHAKSKPPFPCPCNLTRAVQFSACKIMGADQSNPIGRTAS